MVRLLGDALHFCTQHGSQHLHLVKVGRGGGKTTPKGGEAPNAPMASNYHKGWEGGGGGMGGE